jgi:hypothetical protein
MRRTIAALVMTSLAGLTAACSSTPDPSSPTTAAATGPTVTCRSVSGTDDVGQKITLSDCSGPTGGSGTVMGPFGSPTVVHWASGGTTQLVFDTNTQHTASPSCPTQVTVLDGRVVGAGGVSGEVRGVFCIDASRTITLLPGTTFTI